MNLQRITATVSYFCHGMVVFVIRWRTAWVGCVIECLLFNQSLNISHQNSGRKKKKKAKKRHNFLIKNSVSKQVHWNITDKKQIHTCVRWSVALNQLLFCLYWMHWHRNGLLGPSGCFQPQQVAREWPAKFPGAFYFILFYFYKGEKKILTFSKYFESNWSVCFQFKRLLIKSSLMCIVLQHSATAGNEMCVFKEFL